MASDSDDDFSYTNSADLLNNLKKDVSLKNNEQTKLNNFFTDSEEEVSVVNKSVIEDVPVKNVSVTESTLNLRRRNRKCTAKPNDSCIILSDEEIINSPVNILSTIDGVLQKRSRGRSGKSRKTNSTPKRVTRQNKTRKKAVPSKNISNDVVSVEEDTKLEDCNYDISVKVIWKSQNMVKFNIRRFEKLTKIFKYFADEEKIPEERLHFTIGKTDTIISKDDTPDSLKLTAATIIEGGVLCNKKNQSSVISYHQDKDQLQLKVQVKDRKRPFTVTIKFTDRMEVLMYKCANELNVPVTALKFYFDGDLIKSTDTPNDLQLEGGECFDCLVNL